MKKINEEVSGRKRKSFNVRRFAAVAASIFVLIGTTVFVEAKFGITDRISNLYTAWQSEDVILDKKEKSVIGEISLEIGYEFEVDGGKVRIDGIMYDSLYIYFMYTAIADDGNQEIEADIFSGKFTEGGFEGSDPTLIINGRTYSGGSFTVDDDADMDENEEGRQGCYIFHVSPNQVLKTENGRERINNFSLSQGDEIILTDQKYINKNFRNSHSMDDVEKIYGTFTLEKPINTVTFTCDNTEGMNVLETITEIRLSPLSVIVMGDELLRKTYPEDKRGIKIGIIGDETADRSVSGYAVSIVKKDGTVAKYGTVGGSTEGTVSNDNYKYFYTQNSFEKPLDLTEVDYILVKGWGLEYKIPVNAE